MSGMHVKTWAGNFQRIRQTSTTDSSYPTGMDLDILGYANKPTGVGDNASQTTKKAVIDVIGQNTMGGGVPNWAKIHVYGVGSNNHVITFKLYSYTLMEEPSGDPATAQWIVSPLCEVTCTLSSNLTGAGSPIGATNLFADTMVLVGTSGDAGISMSLFNPADDATKAHIQISLKGAHLLVPTFKKGSGTDCNGLIQLGY